LTGQKKEVFTLHILVIMGHRRKWSSTEKLEAVNLLNTEGIVVVSRKFGVSTTTLRNWSKTLESEGIDGLDDKVLVRKNTEFESLRRENNSLKMIVAEKELTIRIQAELLKKKR
jgi:putative transposase